jgi:nucleoside-triphosphatase
MEHNDILTKNLLITGRPGIGKSTVIKRVVLALGTERVGGFWSSEIRSGSKRVGFAIETVNGDKGILAHVNLRKGPRMGKYRINIEDIDSVAIRSMALARSEGKIIIIDEIATMELFSPNFAPEVMRCLDTCSVIGTIQERRKPFLDSIRARADVTLMQVTLSNREHIHLDVLSLLSQTGST